MPEKNVILIVRTRKKNDEATRYIFDWAGIVKKEAELLGLQVIDLVEDGFTKKNFKKSIKKFDPYLVFLNGHGTESSFKGRDGKTDVIIRCENDYLFNGRVVYSLSCRTARILGKSAMNKGCKSYIGYTKKVFFPYQNKFDDPIKDYVAASFMKVSNEIILTLIKGGTSEEAINNFHTLSDNLITYWEKSYDPFAPTIKKYLERLKEMIYAPI